MSLGGVLVELPTGVPWIEGELEVGWQLNFEEPEEYYWDWHMSGATGAFWCESRPGLTWAC